MSLACSLMKRRYCRLHIVVNFQKLVDAGQCQHLLHARLRACQFEMWRSIRALLHAIPDRAIAVFGRVRPHGVEDVVECSNTRTA